MSASEESVNKLIRDAIDVIVNDPSNFTTIRASQQNAPRPAGDYADVNIISDINLGWEQRSYTTNGSDLDENIEGLREMSYSINFYRDGSKDFARKVRTGLVRNKIQAAFGVAGVGLIRRSEVRNTTEALEDTFESRAQFDLFISLVGTDTDLVNGINALAITGQYQTGTNNPVIPTPSETIATVDIDIVRGDFGGPYLLLENGGRLLLEAGGALLLED